VLNAANEIAVELFLEGKIPFLGIPELIEQSLEEHKSSGSLTVDSLIAIDSETRQLTRERAKSIVSA
jgi:1-deoxy-D-xylulose-5-phosphate reductoisomerase